MTRDMAEMGGDQIASLIYLILLGVVIAGWLFAANRHQMGKMAQHLAIWVFIFLGAIVTVGLWTDIRDDILPRQNTMMDGSMIEVPMAMDGHFYLTLELDGTPVRFVVDTGASDMVLSTEDALRVGIDPERLIFSGRAYTANGIVETAPVTIESVTLGSVSDSNVHAVVNAGGLSESLLGMSYLRRFERLEISNGRMVLER